MIDEGFRVFPVGALTFARHVDALFLCLLGLSAALMLGIAGAILYFAVKYRRGSAADRTGGASGNLAVEISWILIPLVINLGIFVWGASVFFRQQAAPDTALDIHVVGKQWMWKFQHPDGRREINELHVPRGTPVRLKMISEDVIHDVYIPAFRIKQDVLPGEYSEEWFEATELGEFRLLCAEYCGTQHSRMGGKVVVLEPAGYQAWLAEAAQTETPAEAGWRLFEQMSCTNCHRGGGVDSRGPPLQNLFGSPVPLADGRTVIADEAYLRESILQPASKVVAGYQPIMPPFAQQIGEEGLNDLVAYIKSLTSQPPEQSAP